VISRIIDFSIRRRWFVAVACLAASVLGAWSLPHVTVRAFMAAVVRKKLGLRLESEMTVAGDDIFGATAG
jgi:hypothetical protein